MPPGALPSTRPRRPLAGYLESHEISGHPRHPVRADDACGGRGAVDRTYATRRQRLILVALIGAAAALRLWGIQFGFPLVSNFYIRPDESLLIVPALRFFDWNGDPHFYVYPALMITLNAMLFHGSFAIASALGSAAPTLAADFAADPSRYFLLARLVAATAGTATVPIVFAFGRRVGGASTGLLAAALFATAPLAVRDAHFGVTDTPLAFFAAGTILAVMRYLQTREGRDAAAAGMLLGLAAGTKYPGVLLLPIVIGAIVSASAWRRQALQHIVLAVALAAVAFAATNPRVASGSPKALAEIRAILTAKVNTAAAADAPADTGGAFAPLRYGPGMLPGVGFAVLALFRRQRAARAPTVLLAAAALVFLLPSLATAERPYRYAVPAIPFLAALAGHGIGALRSIPPVLLGRTLMWLAAIGTLAPGAWASAQIDHLLAQEDTRTLAGRWIAEHVPATMPIVIWGGAPECEPQIHETPTSLRRRIDYVWRMYRGSGARVAELYDIIMRMLSVQGHEVYRNDAQVNAPLLCVVRPSYPLPNPSCPRPSGADSADPYKGESVRSVRFESVPTTMSDAGIDAVDAFFLPLDHLAAVSRPGPNLDIRIIKRSESPHPTR